MGYENSGEGDPAERFRPRHHPTHSSQPPQHKKPGAAAQAEQQSLRATGCTHSAKQGATELQDSRSQGVRQPVRGGGTSHARIR